MTDSPRSAKRWLLLALKALVLASVFFFAGRALWRALENFDPARLELDAAGIALALLVGLLSLAPMVLVYRGYLEALGQPLSWRQAFVLTTLPRLGTFVPGKLGSVLGLAWIGHHLSRLPLRASMTFGLLLTIQAAAISAVAAFGLSFALPMAWPYRLGLGSLAAGGLLALHPRLVRAPIDWLLRRLGKEGLAPMQGGYGLALGMAALALAQKLLMLGAWMWLAGQLLDLPASALPAVGLAFVLAALAGLLVLIAPAGLGVQEGIMLLLLSPFMAAADAAALTIAARLYQILLLLLGAGLGAALLPGARTNHSH